MSGVEIVAAAAAVSLVASGVSAYEQVQTANQAASMQAQQLREQAVQLRLQQNQQSLNRISNLRKVLATEEVSFGAKNISGASGTVQAITMENMHNFYEDENADQLNYGAKQLAITRQTAMVWQQRRAQVFGAVTGFVKEGASTVMAAYGVPSQSLMDASKGGTSNVGGSAGYQAYAAGQRKQFNING